MQIKEEKMFHNLIFLNFILALNDQKLIRYKNFGAPN